MNRTLLTLAAIAACLALFLAVNIVGGSLVHGARLDLTDNHLYTLSEGSRQVTRKIDEPITLTLYLSEKAANGLPEIKSYATRVREFLREYAAASGGKIKLETIDPEPYSDAEEKANQAGIYGNQTPTLGERLYFGLVGRNSVGQTQVIPFFDSRKEEFLEYDLTRLIYLLSNPKKNTVGIMASLPINGVQDNPLMRGQDSPPWQVAAQMKELFEVKNIDPKAAEIPADLRVLMVVHPKNLSDATLYAIDQFVMRGGRLMVFEDPQCEADVPPGINQFDALKIPKASDMNKLLGAYGVEMTPERFAADRESAIRVQAGSQAQPKVVSAVYLLDLRKAKDSLSKTDPVIGQLDHITMGIPGILTKKPEAQITFEPLITTTRNAEPMDVKVVQFMPDAEKILADFKSEDKPLTLAARITGKLKSAFPNGNPTKPAEKKEGEAAPAPDPSHLAESTGTAEIIVVADCDMLSDRFWVQEQRFGQLSLGYQKWADNGDFVIQSLDNLGGSSDLASLRARAKFARPFDRVERIQRDAEDHFLKRQQELKDNVQKIDTKINEILRQAPQGGSVILSADQQAEMAKLKADSLAVRHELREVQHQMNKDIEALGLKMKVLNVALMPMAIGLFAIGLSIYRVNRRRSYKAAAPSART